MKIPVEKSVKALIFDIDGTLVDTIPAHLNAWKKFAANHGFSFPDNLFYELTGVPTIKLVPIINEKLGLDLDVTETVSEKEKYFLELLSGVKPIMKVVEVAEEYFGRLPMSLGTGGRRDIANLTIKAAGLEKYFPIMVAAEDVENHKPHPDTFLKCAELMNVSPKFCQVFEDGDLGLEAGRRAGMITTDIRKYI